MLACNGFSVAIVLWWPVVSDCVFVKDSTNFVAGLIIVAFVAKFHVVRGSWCVGGYLNKEGNLNLFRCSKPGIEECTPKESGPHGELEENYGSCTSLRGKQFEEIY